MPKRQRIKRGQKSFYVERRKDGTFKDWINIGKSINKDKRIKAKKKVKPGHGGEGDL